MDVIAIMMLEDLRRELESMKEKIDEVRASL